MKTKHLLHALVVLSLLGTAVQAKDAISSLQDKAKQSEQRKLALQSQRQKIIADIGKTEDKVGKLKDLIIQTDTELASIDANIARIQSEITSTEADMVKTELKLKDKKDILAKNLRILYSQGDVKMSEYLFRSDNLVDFLDRFKNIQMISNANKNLFDEVKAALNQLKTDKASLLQKQAETEQEKLNQTAIQQQQQQNRQEQLSLLGSLHSQEDDVASNIASEDKAIAQFNAQIAEAIRKREEERKRWLAEEERRKKQGLPKQPNGDLVGTGQFRVPINSGDYRISSPFGYRVHPVTHVKTFHSGVDFAAAYGTPILAADDGYVLYAGSASGFGHWVVIDHNNGLYTIYGHMYSNQIFVSQGQNVKKGQKIAAVGSDGVSTGYHLHFSVATGYRNGSFNYVDPMNYFK